MSHVLCWKCSCFLPVGKGWKQMAADRGRVLGSREWATDGKAHMPPSPLSLPAVPWLTVGRYWPGPGWGWREDLGEEWSVPIIEKKSTLYLEISSVGGFRSHSVEDAVFYPSIHFLPEACLRSWGAWYLSSAEVGYILGRLPHYCQGAKINFSSFI